MKKNDLPLLITGPEICEELGIDRYQWMHWKKKFANDPNFPKGFPRGTKRQYFFLRSEYEAWIQEKNK